MPIIAFDSTAVGETLGTGGMLISNKYPAKTAELMHMVIEISELREKMIQDGPDTYTHLTLPTNPIL